MKWCATFFLVFFLTRFFSCEKCESRSTCLDCFNTTKLTECVWCVKFAGCINYTKWMIDRTLCPEVGNVLYLRSKREKEIAEFLHYPPPEYGYPYIPINTQKCDNVSSVYLTGEECPPFIPIIQSDQETSTYLAKFLISPIDPQPRLYLDDITNGSLLDHTFVHQTTTIVGLYFIDDLEEPVKVFSFIHDSLKEVVFADTVFSSYATSDKYKFVGFTDLTMHSTPGTYSFGFSLIVQRGNETYCMFKPSSQKMEIVSSAKSYFTNSLNLTLVISSLVLLSIAVFIVLVLQPCFHRTDSVNNNEVRDFYPHLGNLPRYLKMIMAMVYVRRVDLLISVGFEAWLFLKFEEILVIGTLIYTLISLVFVLPVNVAHPSNIIDGLAKLTSATIPYSSYIFTFHSIAAVFYFFVILLVVYLLHRLSRSGIQLSEDMNITYHTVRVKRVPREVIRSETVLKIFREIYGDENVVSCFVAFDLEKLHYLLKDFEQIEKKITKIKAKVSKLENMIPNDEVNREKYEQKITKKSKKLPKLEEKLKVFQDEVDEYRDSKKTEIHGTGSAFVTFTSEKLAEKCVRDFGSREFHRNNPSVYIGMVTELAVESNQINWENLGYTKLQYVLRYIGVYAGVTFFVICATLVVLIIQFFNITRSFLLTVLNLLLEYLFAYKVVQDNEMYDRSYFASLISKFNSVFNAIPLILTIVNLFSVPLAKFTASRHKNQTKRGLYQSEIHIGSVMIFLNTFLFGQLFSLIVYGIITLNAEDNSFEMISFSRDVISSTLVMQVFFKGLEALVMVLAPLFICGRCKFKRPGTAYSGSYALRFLFFMWITFFGVSVPISSPLILLGTIFTYLVDRFFIFFFYKKSQKIDSSSINAASYFMAFIGLVYPFYFTILNLSRIKIFTFYYAMFYVLCLAISNIVILFLIHYVLRKKRNFLRVNRRLKKFDGNLLSLSKKRFADLNVPINESSTNLYDLAKDSYEHPLVEFINLEDRTFSEIENL